MSISYHDHDQEYGQMYCHKRNPYCRFIFCKYIYLFSRESDSRISNVRLSVSLSVCYKNPSASQNCSYRPSSHQQSSLSTIYWLSDLLSRLLSHFGLLLIKAAQCKTKICSSFYQKYQSLADS